jgi:hypothetical protein
MRSPEPAQPRRNTSVRGPVAKSIFFVRTATHPLADELETTPSGVGLGTLR